MIGFAPCGKCKGTSFSVIIKYNRFKCKNCGLIRSHKTWSNKLRKSKRKLNMATPKRI